jgi:hypothetical protein
LRDDLPDVFPPAAWNLLDIITYRLSGIIPLDSTVALAHPATTISAVAAVVELLWAQGEFHPS